MRRNFLPMVAMAMAVCAFVGCEKNTPKPPFKIDNNKMISLRAGSTAMVFKSGAVVGDTIGDTIFTDYLYTPREIVDSAGVLRFFDQEQQGVVGRGFADGQRDTINNRLLMNGTDILNYWNETDSIRLEPFFIEGRDVVIVKGILPSTDTLAYIPNAVMERADSVIKALYKAKRYEDVYKEFDKAYYFIPITGARYRYLKERGEN